MKADFSTTDLIHIQVASRLSGLRFFRRLSRTGRPLAGIGGPAPTALSPTRQQRVRIQQQRL
jgi:hypothetical protein